MTQRYCTQADLERALGGARELVQLLDKDGDNRADADLVAQVLDAGSAELASYFINLDLNTIREPYPPALIIKTADACAFYAWRYGAYGQGVPDSIMQGYDKAVGWAKDVGNKQATLGVVAEPSLREAVGVVDFDELGEKVSIAGFKKGFR